MTIHADDKLQFQKPFPASLTRRRQVNDSMSDIEMKSSMSTKTFTVLLGVAVLLLCFIYSFYLQQKMNESHVSDLVDQFWFLRTLIKYGTWYFYPSPVQIHDVLTFVAFADACHINDSSQV